MNLPKIIVFLCTFIATILSISAQESNEKRILANGYVQIDHMSFFKEKTDKANGRNQGILQFDLVSKMNENYSFFSTVEFRNDISDKSRNRVYIKETYIDLFFKKWDLRIGKQIFSWGKADGFNPMNTLGPIDYTDVLDTDNEKIGIFALNVKYYLEEYEIQAVFSPIFTSTIFPSADSRWQFEMPGSISVRGENYRTEYNISMLKPEDKLKNGSVALKLARSFRLLDASLSYFYGYRHIPEIIQQIEMIDATNEVAQINIVQQYYPQQVISGDFSLVLGKYILKGEGGMYFPKGIPNNKPYFQYVTGIDRVFNNVIGNNNLNVILQWMHEFKSDNIDYSGRDFNHLFQKNLMCRFEQEFSSNIQISLQGVYALKYEDFYLKPKFAYNISDGLNLSVSADILGGNKTKNGLFSGFSDNNRIHMQLKYSF